MSLDRQSNRLLDITLPAMVGLIIANDERQADPHRRLADDVAADEQIAARAALVAKITEFVYLEDQNLDVATFAETVACRLLEYAANERHRRRRAAPDGFTHLVCR